MNEHIRDAIYAEPFDPYHPALAPVVARLLNPESQYFVGEASLGLDSIKTGGTGRFIVMLTRRGTRLLDVDNLAGGCKALIDACRYENLIPADDPSAIDLFFRQQKVKRPFIGTEIQITPI